MNQALLPDDYLPLLDELNRIVIQSGEPLEGNLFYRHNEPHPGRNNILEFFAPKRANFAAACAASTRMLEIGLNAGHSALLALANGVEYHGVDICEHSYTRPAAAFLKKTFGNRFHFYEGDSLRTLPAMRSEHPDLRFDLLHIDGHHHVHICRSDTANAMKMALNGAWIIIDDTDIPPIRAFFDEQVAAGKIIADTPEGWTGHPHHAIGKVNHVQGDYFSLLSSMYQSRDHSRKQQDAQDDKLRQRLQLQQALILLSQRIPEVFFVQIGAGDGILYDPLHAFIRKYGWKGVLAEPLPDRFALLKKHYAEIEGLAFENAAVAEAAGMRPILRAAAPALPQLPAWAGGYATLLEGAKPPEELQRHLATEQVRAMTLPDLLQKYTVRRIDILQIDTVGYDYRILSQLDFRAFRPSVIHLGFEPLTEQEKQQVYDLLKRHDYLCRIQDGHLLAAQKSFLADDGKIT